MKAQSKRRGGFTLIEILVTLIVLSVLVAAVFPVLIQQVDEAGPPRVASDLASIKTGIEAFKANVRTAAPGDLEDLFFAISSSASAGDQAVDGSYYSNTQEARWNGPYIDASVEETTAGTGSVIPTGFDGFLDNDLTLCAVASGNACAAPSGTSGFITVKVNSLTAGQWAEINEILDQQNESNSMTAGKWRWDGSVAYYFATPN